MIYSIPNTIEIPLTKGYVTVVDECDGDLASFKWCTQIANGLAYAIRRGWNPVTKEAPTILLHRVILGRMLGVELTRGQVADHINRDRMINCRWNLRVATVAQNTYNRSILRNNKSGYPGIAWSKASKKWQAQIGINNRQIFLGFFVEFADAVEARQRAEREYFGEFAPKDLI